MENKVVILEKADDGSVSILGFEDTSVGFSEPSGSQIFDKIKEFGQADLLGVVNAQAKTLNFAVEVLTAIHERVRPGKKFLMFSDVYSAVVESLMPKVVELPKQKEVKKGDKESQGRKTRRGKAGRR
jgi:hypothetical protein